MAREPRQIADVPVQVVQEAQMDPRVLTPSAFGGAKGKALSALGQGVQVAADTGYEIGMDLLARENKRKLDTMQTEFLQKKHEHEWGENGWRNLKGEQAVAAQKQAIQDLEAFRQELLARHDIPIIRSEFDPWSARQTLAHNEELAQHVFTQQKNAEDAAAEAKTQALSNEWVTTRTLEAKEALSKQVRERATALGLSPAVGDQMVAATISKGHEQIIENLISENNWPLATAYFKMVKREINGDRYDVIQSQLDSANLSIWASEQVDKYIDSGLSANDLRKEFRTLANGDSRKLEALQRQYDSAMSLKAQRAKAAEVALEQSFVEQLQSLANQVANGAVPAHLIMQHPEFSKMGNDAKRSAINILERIGQGQTLVTNPKEFNAISQLPVPALRQYLRENPIKVRTQISADDMKMFEQRIADYDADQKKGLYYNVTDHLFKIGHARELDESDRHKLVLAGESLYRSMRDQNGKPPSIDEFDAAVNKYLLTQQTGFMAWARRRLDMDAGSTLSKITAVDTAQEQAFIDKMSTMPQYKHLFRNGQKPTDLQVRAAIVANATATEFDRLIPETGKIPLLMDWPPVVLGLVEEGWKRKYPQKAQSGQKATLDELYQLYRELHNMSHQPK